MHVLLGTRLCVNYDDDYFVTFEKGAEPCISQQMYNMPTHTLSLYIHFLYAYAQKYVYKITITMQLWMEQPTWNCCYDTMRMPKFRLSKGEGAKGRQERR